ncbi:SAM-dependent methyltransferase [Chitinibacter bivalviorum]|uniref:Chemotaxis protein methyltransferase n=1 Tax=Chitinibacter bivalviorum TaxID=2739434 RepID=A0A7H9BMJ3_9NEIS|nr:CheR family methyltransferase [Chitinibacter bivalviorum]QLG89311.1 SAM-dependent methyltransferase [Chitinibacter bivalviorum]
MQLSDATFQRYSQWMKAQTGVHFTDIKKTLVTQRLMRRLHARKIDTFEAYFRLLTHKDEEAERQLALDLLTTHETFFFREPKHFDWLKQFLLQPRPHSQVLRFWSAAASSGEEVWSIAMMLADCLGVAGPWQLMGSDISQPVIDKARGGHYVMQRCDGIPVNYLKKFCLKGQGTQLNTLLIMRELRQRVEFKVINLIEEFPSMAPFDVIFLRNVLIYFDIETKAQVVNRCIQRLQPGGFLLVSHSESLNGMSSQLRLIQAGIYQKTL